MLWQPERQYGIWSLYREVQAGIRVNRLHINRVNVREQFESYIAPYDLSDPKIRLKAEHTYRVAELCARIAASLSVPAEDEDLAWLLGMLHDIGRFEQVRRYGTFVDAQSVDHAAFGADLLFQENLIRRFVSSDEEDSLIEQSIRLHNVFQLPEDSSDRERTFAQILRDADKIDIVRVNCEFPRSEIYNLPEEEFLMSDISDEVLQDALSMRNVLRAHRRTAADYIVGQISLTFGLVYEESRRIIREQGYLDHIMNYESRNPETMRRLELIRGRVEQFLQGAG
ncbi:MAG: HD domain-containing protein [Lachnospiraceae bacterium]|nr:HD domain-containing protein [Lachnospiraceae bacterium]